MADEAPPVSNTAGCGLDLLGGVGLDAFLPGMYTASDDIGHAYAGSARYGFEVGTIHLLVPPMKVCEVVEKAPVCALPNSEDWLLGMVNLRGTLVPMFDLHRLLGEEYGAASESRYLIIGKGIDAVGIVIDGLPQPVDTCSPMKNMPPLAQALIGMCDCAYIDNDTVWLNFDVDAFFKFVSAGRCRPGDN